MKKILLSILVLGSFTAFAQDGAAAEGFKSKNGADVLPASGDYAVGFNALPVFNYFGNAISAGSNGLMSANFVDGNNQIYLKQFTSATSAYRIRLRVWDNISTTNNYVVQDGQWNDDVTVTDSRTWSSMGLTIGGGMEKRRGSGRVQGVYGVEGTFMMSTSGWDYSYGNAMSAGNVAPSTTTNFSSMTASNSSDRQLTSGGATTWGLGANAFVGVEYFFAPKMSVGAEFTWGAMYVSTGEGTETREQFTNAVVTETNVTAGSSSFSLDTGASGGAIFLNFHF